MKNYNLLKFKENLLNFLLDTINILYYVVTYYKFIGGGFWCRKRLPGRFTLKMNS